MTWPFDPLNPLSYDLIMADPPWSFELRSEAGEAKSPQAKYDCMSTPDICALPVGQLARGDCWLWLWGTYPMLPDALKVMEAWGFRYVTAGPWVKRGKSGKLSFGPGYVLRTCSEIFMLGKMGDPKTLNKSTRNVIESPRREHSRKPDEAYSVCESLFPAMKRADLFSRESRPGWDSWGNESGKFDQQRDDSATLLPVGA